MSLVRTRQVWGRQLVTGTAGEDILEKLTGLLWSKPKELRYRQ